VRAAICACLFVLACKGESKPAASAVDDTPTPTERAPNAARPRPALPQTADTATPGDDGRERPQLPERDWSDPAVRDELRQMREERRREREAALDTNKDGIVSEEERLQRMAPMHKRLDADGDGKVTPDELASSDRRMGFDDPAAVDTNNDGEISLAELEAAVTARREKMRERWRGRDGGRMRGGSGNDRSADQP
jgi:hypothetical protein